jgi:hypothetical protein
MIATQRYQRKMTKDRLVWFITFLIDFLTVLAFIIIIPAIKNLHMGEGFLIEPC